MRFPRNRKGENAQSFPKLFTLGGQNDGALGAAQERRRYSRTVWPVQAEKARRKELVS